jgi:hypothetical protein
VLSVKGDLSAELEGVTSLTTADNVLRIATKIRFSTVKCSDFSDIKEIVNIRKLSILLGFMVLWYIP